MVFAAGFVCGAVATVLAFLVWGAHVSGQVARAAERHHGQGR